ncbi:MAG: DNA polymerase III subunit delta' [Lysobacteraceae bacterium]
MSIDFSPWQQRLWRTLDGARAGGRLGHALLFVGPPQLGKTSLARALAQRLLCSGEPTADGRACGQCRGCRLFASGSHPDFRSVGLETNEKSGKLRSEIVVDQIRDLAQWLLLTSRFGGNQVALIEPADLLGHATANALLKTLEEPLPGRYLLLVSARPARLPATIRSRCQRMNLPLPPATEARDWLLAQGIEPAQADTALAAAGGHPGLARAYLQDGRLALREAVRADLIGLAQQRRTPLAVAMQWAESGPSECVRFAAEFAHDLSRQSAAGGASTTSGLTAPDDFSKLAQWFDEANRIRGLLDAPLRLDLLLTALLRQWQAAWRS